MKAPRPVLFLAIVLMLVGLACSAVTGGGDTPEPPAATQVPVNVTEAPTEEPTTEPTAEPTEEATEEPTQEPVSNEAQDFYVEEFGSDFNPDNWQYFIVGDGDDDNLVIEQRDDYLYFDLGAEQLYVYYMYAPYIYSDVSLELNALNQGRNDNNVSLICRMNDEGTEWYEFSVESGGLWFLYAFEDGYNRIANGGTNDLRQGKEQNTYRMECVGDEITLYINDKKLNTIRDSKYFFNEGYVGFNISSLDVLPITLEVNWFEIAQPD
jgi:hypothetical protein